MSKRKLLYLISLLVLIAFGVSLYYFNQYHIEDNDVSIQSNLKDWMNRGNVEELNPNILKIEQIDNTTSHIILFKLDNGDYGYSQLIKGFNGKFKIERSGYGTGVYTSSYEVMDTNKGKYMILYGGNPNLKIDHILAETHLGEFDYKFDTSLDKTIMKFTKIPNNIEKPFPVKLSFYDKNNNEIQ